MLTAVPETIYRNFRNANFLSCLQLVKSLQHSDAVNSSSKKQTPAETLIFFQLSFSPSHIDTTSDHCEYCNISLTAPKKL